ncbi:unnamed protein product [Closterium sp. NIES-54]
MGDFSRYNTVLPLQQKADMLDALLPWLVAVRTQRARSVLRLHSDHGGKFTSGRLEKLCRAEGIRQMYLLLGSPQQNGVAERCVDLVMEITRTSMRRASIPHFRWPFVVYYGTRQLDLWPRVSCPHVLLTLHLGPLPLPQAQPLSLQQPIVVDSGGVAAGHAGFGGAVAVGALAPAPAATIAATATTVAVAAAIVVANGRPSSSWPQPLNDHPPSSSSPVPLPDPSLARFPPPLPWDLSFASSLWARRHSRARPSSHVPTFHSIALLSLPPRVPTPVCSLPPQSSITF